MRTYYDNSTEADFFSSYDRYGSPHDELADYAEGGDYFAAPARRPRAKARKRAKKSHGFRNFVLLLLVLCGVLLAAKHYGAGTPLSLPGLDIFGHGAGTPNTDNVLIEYNVDLASLGSEISAYDSGYYPSDEDMQYLRQAAENNPKLSDKLAFFTEHIGAYSRGAVLTLYLSPEKADYVLQDPARVGAEYQGERSIDVKKGEIPLLVQYDVRWGNHIYGSGGMGNTGCGPTCVSMVAAGLTGNGSLTPDVVADNAQADGFYVDGTGTSWALFTEGVGRYGLEGRELPLDEADLKQAIKDGGAVILSLGAGDFTINGHFIVLSDYSGGRFAVCDPSSIERSGKLWDADELLSQAVAAWALTPTSE